jgi:hypothetical protein
MVEGLAGGHENGVFGLDRSWMRWKMTASSSEFAVAQRLSEVASKRVVLMTAIGETLGFPFSDPFRPPTALAATVNSLAAVVQGIRVLENATNSPRSASVELVSAERTTDSYHTHDWSALASVEFISAERTTDSY